MSVTSITQNTVLDTELRIVEGDTYDIAAGVTLTVNAVQRCHYPLFTGAGTVRILYPCIRETVWWGRALTESPVQKALDSLDPVNGGVVNVTLPGVYAVANPILVLGKNCWGLTGPGRDACVFEADLINFPVPVVPSAACYGILTVDAADFYSRIKQVKVGGLRFRWTNTGVPGDRPDLGTNDGPLYLKKNLYFSRVDGIEFDRVAVENSRWEALYGDGDVQNVRMSGSLFKGTQHNAFNLNTRALAGAHVVDNEFVECARGISLVGSDVSLVDNRFKRTSNPIAVTETSAMTTMNTGKGLRIGGNIISEMGYLTTGNASCIGVDVQVAYNSAMTDTGISDHAILIDGNIVRDSIHKVDNGGSVTGFRVRGNAKLNGNIVSGLKNYRGALDAYDTAFLIGMGSVENGKTGKQEIELTGNSLMAPQGSDTWRQGLSILCDDTCKIKGGGNSFRGITAGMYGMIATPVGGKLPEIVFDADTFEGAVAYGGVWTHAADGSVPLHGSSSAPRTGLSDGLAPPVLTVNSTTPSVKGLRFAEVRDTALCTKTDLLDGTDGQKLTLLFFGNYTSINTCQKIRMKWPGPIGDSSVRSFICRGGIWYER